MVDLTQNFHDESNWDEVSGSEMTDTGSDVESEADQTASSATMLGMHVAVLPRGGESVQNFPIGVLVPRGPSNDALTEERAHSLKESTRLGAYHKGLGVPWGLIMIFLATLPLLTVVWNIQDWMRVALVPVCSAPVFSTSMTERCTAVLSATISPNTPDYSRLVVLQERFGNIMEIASVPGQALEFKSSVLAIHDLTVVVEDSDLENKDILAQALKLFVSDAGQAGRGLHQLGSKVGGAVESILTLNEGILRRLEVIGDTPASTISQLLGYVPGLQPSSSLAEADRKTLVSLFSDAADELKEELERLIPQAEASIMALDKLEEELRNIHKIVRREGSAVQEKADEVLSQLWTILGGNKRLRSRLTSQKELLADVGTYRATAVRRVSATLTQLEELSSDLEDIHYRVTVPALRREAEIPIEVNIESIRKGIKQLEESKRKTKEREHEQVAKYGADSPGPVPHLA